MQSLLGMEIDSFMRLLSLRRNLAQQRFLQVVKLLDSQPATPKLDSTVGTSWGFVVEHLVGGSPKLFMQSLLGWMQTSLRSFPTACDLAKRFASPFASEILLKKSGRLSPSIPACEHRGPKDDQQHKFS